MITVILKNTTGQGKTYGGIVIQASGQRDLTNAGEILRESTVLSADIDAGDIIVNDGTSDLSIERGKAHLFAGVYEHLFPYHFAFDRQMAKSSELFSTTSRTLVGIDSMTLTTRDLGAPGTYVITFCCDYNHQSDADEVMFSLQVDGVEVAMGKGIGGKFRKTVGFSMAHRAGNLVSGVEIKVYVLQSSTNPTRDELNIYERRLIIDGVHDENVV
jgi:hypothetical protein